MSKRALASLTLLVVGSLAVFGGVKFFTRFPDFGSLLELTGVGAVAIAVVLGITTLSKRSSTTDS